MFAEHNLSFRFVDHFIEFLQTLAVKNGPEIIFKMCADRLKCPSIVKNFTGKYAEAQVIGILRENPVHLGIDVIALGRQFQLLKDVMKDCSTASVQQS